MDWHVFLHVHLGTFVQAVRVCVCVCVCVCGTESKMEESLANHKRVQPHVISVDALLDVTCKV